MKVIDEKTAEAGQDLLMQVCGGEEAPPDADGEHRAAVERMREKLNEARREAEKRPGRGRLRIDLGGAGNETGGNAKL